jgi:hypothetical protein
MAKRMNDGVELIKTLAGNRRRGSRPKPPKAVVRGASLEAQRSLPDHEKAKRRLTGKTVALEAFAPLIVRDKNAVEFSGHGCPSEFKVFEPGKSLEQAPKAVEGGSFGRDGQLTRRDPAAVHRKL